MGKVDAVTFDRSGPAPDALVESAEAAPTRSHEWRRWCLAEGVQRDALRTSAPEALCEPWHEASLLVSTHGYGRVAQAVLGSVVSRRSLMRRHRSWWYPVGGIAPADGYPPVVVGIDGSSGQRHCPGHGNRHCGCGRGRTARGFRVGDAASRSLESHLPS